MRGDKDWQRRAGEVLDRHREMVARWGWAVTGVLGDEHEPGWMYTTGLAAMDHPEIVIYGLPPEVAHHVISDMVDRVRQGMEYEPGRTYGEVISGYDVAVVPVDDVDDPDYPLNMTMRTYGEMAFTAVQVVWPDAQGRFPWDEGFNVGGTQRLFGTWEPSDE